jgi:hypothetical protein
MLTSFPYAACLSVIAIAAAADEADIAKSLDAARNEFTKSIELANESYLTSIDDAIKKAAATGSLDIVKALQVEKRQFELDNKFESKMSRLSSVTNRYQASVKSARDRLRTALESAKTSYTKLLKIPEAEAIQRELDSLDDRSNDEKVPSIQGTWMESPGILFRIEQKGKRFTATTSYKHPTAGRIRAVVEGEISPDGKIFASLRHTEAPKDWQSQRREATYSKDPDVIKGTAILDGGDRVEFVWTRQP